MKRHLRVSLLTISTIVSCAFNVHAQESNDKVEGISVENSQQVFDGQPHKLTINRSEEATDVVLTYTLLGENGFENATENPEFTEAGTYNLQVTAQKEGLESITLDGTVTIEKRPVTITAEANSKHIGSVDPAFTYQVENEVEEYPIQQGVNLQREEGETPGDYPMHITIGDEFSKNYQIQALNDAIFTITPHDIDSTQIELIDATCRDNGSYKIVHFCKLCDYSDTTSTITIQALGHDMSQPEITKTATCAQFGEKVSKCSRCDTTIITYLPKMPHSWAEDSTLILQATCENKGAVSIKCTVCDTVKIDSIDAIGHLFDTQYTIDIKVGCENAGLKSKHCLHEGCAAAIDSVWEAELGHMMVTDTIYKEATCTENGLTKRICTRCDYVEDNVSTPKHGHEPSDTFTIDLNPTCLNEGARSVHCLYCDTIIIGTQEIVEPLGHNWQVDSIVPATCILDGLTYSSCGRCLITKEETINALGHEFDTIYTVDKPSTCIEDGVKSLHCLHEGCEVQKDVTPIISIGHQWNDTTITIQPTCTKLGEKTIECVVCHDTKKEVLDSLGHNFDTTFTIDKEPWCKSTGSKSHHCLNEGCDVIIDITSIAALGHNMVFDTISVKPTCTEEGESIYKCTRCDVKETHKIDTLGHIFADTFTVDKKATCKEEGIESRHCNREGCIAKIDTRKISKTSHLWVDGEVITQATCLQDGLMKFKCQTCGIKHDSIITKLGHDWEKDYTEDEPATCYKIGSKSKHCSRCDARTGTTIIPKLVHLEGPAVRENIVEPTCTERGSYDNVIRCVRCNELLKTEKKNTPALGHDYEESEEYLLTPTCTQQGLALFTCTRCGNTRTETVDSLGHTPSEEYTIDKVPSCMEPGTKSKHCIRCEYKFDILHIAPLTHQWESDTTLLPTCTKKGIITKTCQREGCSATENVEIDSLGHDFESKYTVDVEATCKAEGKESRHCSRCEAFKDQRAIPVTEHQPGEPEKEDLIPATCLEPGSYTEVIKCKFCGIELSRSKDVTDPPTGHQWEVFSIEAEPTCTEGGRITYECKSCHVKDTRNVEAYGHDFDTTYTVDVPVTCLTDGLQSKHCKRCDIHAFEETIKALGHVAATAIKESEKLPNCTEEGFYEMVTHCKACDIVLHRDTTIVEAKGHQWNEVINTKDATCTEKGEIRHTCQICSRTETFEVSALGHDFADTFTVDIQPTCIDEGTQSKHCSRCNVKSEITSVPVIDHKWSANDTTTVPTCTTKGIITISCEMCGKKNTSEIAALGHAMSDSISIDIAATCTAVGYSSRHCIRCDYKTDNDTLPAIGHLYDKGTVTKEATGEEEGTKEYVCEHCGDKTTQILKKLVTLAENEDGKFFTVKAEGYCQGDEDFIGYNVKGGEAIDFRLSFSDSAKAMGFLDMDWTEAPTDQKIPISIPTDCKEGKYSADIIFRNGDTVETAPMKVTLTVNLSQEFTVAIFRDVISIINDGVRQFDSYQWYHNDEAINGATLPYYQEAGGLTGNYYVIVNAGTETESRSCSRNDFFNPLNRVRDFTVSPIPLQDVANVKLYNYKDGEHKLSVVNEFGVVIYEMTFEGNEGTFQTTQLVSGPYVISIDGVSVKVLKQ